MALECRALHHWYPEGQVLQNIQLVVEEGEFCCIVGPSGCGKSTLLRIFAGILQPSAGQVFLHGQPPAPQKGDIGFVFQEDALFPWLTVGQNIDFGLKARGKRSELRDKLVNEALQKVGLGDYRNYFPAKLSGGMKQRVAIARVLAYQPKILLMDEPFAALDAINRNNLQQELIKLWQSEQKTIIFVTHNIDEAVYLADRVAVLGRKPSTLKDVVKVELPRPRDRTDAGFCRCRRRILELL